MLFSSFCLFKNQIKTLFMQEVRKKINLLHKAGGRVVYFGKKHQRKVERVGLKRQKN